MPELAGRYPVLLIDRVNHAQVATGVEPEKGVEPFFDDIAAEVDEDLAHQRYAEAAVAFMVTQTKDYFDGSVLQVWEDKLIELGKFTENFLQPFQQLALLEQTIDVEQSYTSPWIEKGQKLLLGLDEGEALPMVVASSVNSGMRDLSALMNKRKKSKPFANGCLIHNVIAVDLWKLQDLEVLPRLHFLSHLHADHTDGLNGSWSRGPIFTSPLNARLAKHVSNCDTSFLVPLEFNIPHELPLCQDKDGLTITVTLLVANHVPGSAMFVFSGFFGTVLYTADFRYSPKMFDQDIMHNIDTLYLDNTFFFKGYTFTSRTRVLRRLVDFLKSQPTDQRVYIGVRRLGKESALVQIALALQEKICVTADRLALFLEMGLPDVFTTNPDECRIFLVNQTLLTRRFLEEKNFEKSTIGILLTALFFNWPGGPYSSSHLYGLHVFEYSDHSSCPELFEFVKRLKPKVIHPIVKETEGKGLMRERIEYLRDRVHLSALDCYLSTSPLPEFDAPKFEYPPSRMGLGARRKLKLAQGRHERPYRGPKGPVYASTTDTSASTTTPNNLSKKSFPTTRTKEVQENVPKSPLKESNEILGKTKNLAKSPTKQTTERPTKTARKNEVDTSPKSPNFFTSDQNSTSPNRASAKEKSTQASFSLGTNSASCTKSSTTSGCSTDTTSSSSSMDTSSSSSSTGSSMSTEEGSTRSDRKAGPKSITSTPATTKTVDSPKVPSSNCSTDSFSTTNTSSSTTDSDSSTTDTSSNRVSKTSTPSKSKESPSHGVDAATSITANSSLSDSNSEPKSRTPAKSKRNPVQSPIFKSPAKRATFNNDQEQQPTKKQKVNENGNGIATGIANPNLPINYQKQCDRISAINGQVLNSVTSQTCLAFGNRTSASVNNVEKETQCSLVSASSSKSCVKDCDNSFQVIINKLQDVVPRLGESETLELLNELEKYLNILSETLDHEESVGHA